MHAFPRPPEHPGLFLALRRGIPLALAAGLLGAAVLAPPWRGWGLIGAVACLAEVAPSFRRGGAAYLSVRAAITRWDGWWARAFRPLFRWLGLEERWLLSFCAWNNRRVREAFEARKARRALVLLPHCIQLARCKAPVTGDLTACSRCGQCVVQSVLEAALAQHWDVNISNRSFKTYRAARAFDPDLMVAVACPDRIFKGLLKISEYPSYVIPLSLPHGMCVDTSFDTSRLAEAMEAMAEPKPDQGPNIQPLKREGIA